MFSLKPDPEIRVQTMQIASGGRKLSMLVLSPKTETVHAPGILWIHGGGYIYGMKEMVHMSRAVDLVKKYGAVVVSPGYRLAFLAPYPAALDDCYAALLYMKEHAAELGIREDRLKDFHGLPPAYTFVGDGEPFYAETVRYIEALKACGIPADMDVYPTDTHAFDMMKPQESLSIKAAARFNEVFAYAKENYFAPQAQNR